MLSVAVKLLTVTVWLVDVAGTVKAVTVGAVRSGTLISVATELEEALARWLPSAAVVKVVLLT